MRAKMEAWGPEVILVFFSMGWEATGGLRAKWVVELDLEGSVETL